MRRILGNIFWSTASKVLDAAVRFFTVPIVLGHFGRDDFGLLALAFSINIFLTIADFGLNINAVQRLSELFSQNKNDKLIELIHASTFYYAIIGIFNLVVVLIIGTMADSWFDLRSDQYHAFFVMMASLGFLSLVSWSFATYRQVIQSAGQVGWDERNNLFVTVGTVAVVFFAVHYEWSITSYFIAASSLSVIPIIMRIGKAKQLVPGLTVRARPYWSTFKPLIAASSLIFAMSVAQMLASNLRPVILANRAAIGDVADFRILQQIASFTVLISAGLFGSLYPEIARLEANQDRDRLKLLMVSGTRALLWLHVALLVPLAICSPIILKLYVGAAYVRLSGDLEIWLLTGIFGHLAFLASLTMIRQQVNVLAYWSIANSLGSLALAYVFMPKYGMSSVIISYLGYILLQCLLYYIFILPRLKIGTYRTSLEIALLPFLVCCVLPLLAQALTLIFQVPVLVTAGAAFVFVVLIALLWGRAITDYRTISGRRHV